MYCYLHQTDNADVSAPVTGSVGAAAVTCSDKPPAAVIPSSLVLVLVPISHPLHRRCAPFWMMPKKGWTHNSAHADSPCRTLECFPAPCRKRLSCACGMYGCVYQDKSISCSPSLLGEGPVLCVNTHLLKLRRRTTSSSSSLSAGIDTAVLLASF